MAWEITEKPFVQICIPHTGSANMEWFERTYGPLRFIAQPDYDKQTILSRGILNLATVRNELVKEALKDLRTTHILFLDTDVVVEEPPDPNLALRMLLACNAPIASGLYRAKGRYHYIEEEKSFSYAMWTKNPEGEGYLKVKAWTPGSNWIKVDTIGLGFVLIQKEVFQKVPYPWFKWDEPTPSEDFYFCELLKKNGFEIRVLTDIKCSHIGTFKVKPDGSISTLEV